MCLSKRGAHRRRGPVACRCRMANRTLSHRVAAILLGHLKISADVIKQALCVMDEDLLTPELLKQMLAYAPNTDEVGHTANTLAAIWTGRVSRVLPPPWSVRDALFVILFRLPNKTHIVFVKNRSNLVLACSLLYGGIYICWSSWQYAAVEARTKVIM